MPNIAGLLSINNGTGALAMVRRRRLPFDLPSSSLPLWPSYIYTQLPLSLSYLASFNSLLIDRRRTYVSSSPFDQVLGFLLTPVHIYT